MSQVPDWIDEADEVIAIVGQVAPKRFDGPPAYSAHSDPRYLLAQTHLRWAVWCVESLYQLRDLIGQDDPRGDSHTPLGHRSHPTAFGHITWAAVTAMGALDRVAAAFGALHLREHKNGWVHDFRSLAQSKVKSEPVRRWMRAVETDPAYIGVLDLLRDPLTHRTTRMHLYASAYLGSEKPPYEQRPPHHDAPEFYIGDTDRAISAIGLLEEVIPLTEKHVRAALALVESRDAFPPVDPGQLQ